MKNLKKVIFATLLCLSLSIFTYEIINAEVNNLLQKYMTQFSWATNNINQITKKIHQHDTSYKKELENIIKNQNEMNQILIRIFKGVGILWRQFLSKK